LCYFGNVHVLQISLFGNVHVLQISLLQAVMNTKLVFVF